MNTAQLVKMANQIEAFFRNEPDRGAAIEAIASHLKRFWDPRMRRQIVAHAASGGEGLGELALEAVRRRLGDAQQPVPPGPAARC